MKTRPAVSNARPFSNGRRFRLEYLAIGLMVLIVIDGIATLLGSVYIPPYTLGKILLGHLPMVNLEHDWPESWQTIVWQLRIPRIVLATLVGMALAASGATYQGLFRNPLASPYFIGVSAGAALGATIVLLMPITHSFLGTILLPVAAFAGGLLAVVVAYGIARDESGLPLLNMLLAGVTITFLAGAGSSLLIIRSNPDVRPLLGWLMGSFSAATWQDVVILLPYLIPSLVVMLAYARITNLLQLDEEQAHQLGVSVERTKKILILSASLATAAAVSVSGLIGFVGLMAPHTVRLIWGPDLRFLLPMAMIVGGAFTVLADLVARTALSSGELPVGIITAFCGAPFFLYLLKNQRRRLI